MQKIKTAIIGYPSGYGGLDSVSLERYRYFQERARLDCLAIYPSEFTSGGVSVAGSVISEDPKRAVKATLMRGSEVAYIVETSAEAAGSGPATQDFIFEGVEPGTYSLIIEKDGNLKCTLQGVTVGEEDVTLVTDDTRLGGVPIELICGDLNGDGQINSIDLSLLLADYGKSGAALAGSQADLDGDLQVNSIDLSLLLAGYGKSNQVISPATGSGVVN